MVQHESASVLNARELSLLPCTIGLLLIILGVILIFIKHFQSMAVEGVLK